jgi:hypothetical protein
MAKTITPATSLTASVQKTRIVDIKTQGMMTLNGPNLGTSKFGTTRPTTLDAFKIAICQNEISCEAIII